MSLVSFEHLAGGAPVEQVTLAINAREATQIVFSVRVYTHKAGAHDITVVFFSALPGRRAQGQGVLHAGGVPEAPRKWHSAVLHSTPPWVVPGGHATPPAESCRRWSGHCSCHITGLADLPPAVQGGGGHGGGEGGLTLNLTLAEQQDSHFTIFSRLLFLLLLLIRDPWEWGEGEVQDRGPEQGVSLGRGRVQREGVWGPWENFLPEALERRVGGLRGWGTEELVGLGAETGGFVLRLQAEVTGGKIGQYVLDTDVTGQVGGAAGQVQELSP